MTETGDRWHIEDALKSIEPKRTAILNFQACRKYWKLRVVPPQATKPRRLTNPTNPPNHMEDDDEDSGYDYGSFSEEDPEMLTPPKIPPGSARWSWLSDEVLEHTVRTASIEGLFAFGALDRRARRFAEPRWGRIFALTLPPFRLGNAVLTGRCQSVSFNNPCAKIARYAPSLPGGYTDIHGRPYVQFSAEEVMVLAAAVSRAKALSFVTLLTLDHCGITSIAFESLVQAWAAGAMPRLQSLSVAANRILDSGVTLLSNALTNGALSLLANLDLRWTSFDAESTVEALCSAILALTDLQRVDVRGNELSSGCLALLDSFAIHKVERVFESADE